MPYDYFISHASEDKDLIARPLAHYLSTAAFDVWYDEFALKPGDSLRARIDEGLRESRHGVVILSPAFFAKPWPQRELDGLFAIETAEEGGILPVWHQVTAVDVKRFSPMLADRVAVSTDRGLQAVAEQIVRATQPDRLGALPVNNIAETDAEAGRRARDAFRGLLDQQPSRSDVFLFLSAYHVLIGSLFGYQPILAPGYKVTDELPVDFVVVHPHGISGPMEMILVVLGSPTGTIEDTNLVVQRSADAFGHPIPSQDRPANDYLRLPYAGEYPSVLKLARTVSSTLSSRNVHWKSPAVWNFRLLVVAGRRDAGMIERRADVARAVPLQVEIASYDRLVDSDSSLWE